MEKGTFLLLVLGSMLLQTDSLVLIPFEKNFIVPSLRLYVSCFVENENFQGWFKDTGIKIPQAKGWSDVKDQPAVITENGFTPHSRNYVLVFPKGSPPSVGGRYTCKGDSNQATATVDAPFTLDKLQTLQTLSAGSSGKIVLGAMSYPLSKFTWTKNNVPLDLSRGGRLKLENDGSLVFSNVLSSDAGIYEVKVNWMRNRKKADVKINVQVSGK